MFDIIAVWRFLKKNFSRTDILGIGILLVLFFGTRLVRLSSFPIFGDEGIYIHWAKTAWHDASWRFVSLTDGKQPLQTWGIIPFLKFFPQNALLAGRLFSVTTGFAGLTGMFCLLYYLFGKRIAYFGSLLYVFTPYFLFYDRMALSDSGVNAGFIWMLFFSILLADTIRLDIALLFGLISGLSLLTKSSARLFLGLSIMAPVLFIGKNIKKFSTRLLNFLCLFMISGTIAYAIYNIQRLSPFLHFVEEKNKTFVMTFGQFFKTPFLYVRGNILAVPYYVLSESGVLLFVAGLIGLLLLLKFRTKLALYLLAWLVFPYIAIAFFSIVLYPRYLNFFASLMIIGIAFLLTKIKKPLSLYLLVLLAIISVSYFDLTVFFNQSKIPFPDIDRGQYITGATAGWGVREIVDFARRKSQDKKVLLLAEGDFGVIGDQLEVFINQNDNIQIKGYWPLTRQNLSDNQKELNHTHVYAVFAQRNNFPSDWPIRLIKKFEKPDNQSSTYLFELLAK